jgi:hypothetical protein
MNFLRASDLALASASLRSEAAPTEELVERSASILSLYGVAKEGAIPPGVFLPLSNSNGKT